MTDDQARALGLRLKAAMAADPLEGWRPGMLDLDSRTRMLENWRDPNDDAPPTYTEGPGFVDTHEWSPAGRVMDLRDPATRGAALDVVRERWKCPTLHLVACWIDGQFCGWKWGGLPPGDRREMALMLADGNTEGEALVAAIEVKCP